MRARPLTRMAAAAGLVAALLCMPGGALAQGDAVLRDFSADGRIDPCSHSSEDLRRVQENMPADVEQYAPDYPAAVAAALEARARGDCAPTRAPASPTPAATASPAPTPTPVSTVVPTRTVVPEPPVPEGVPTAAPTRTPAAKPDVALERVATARPANAAPAPVLLLAVLVGLLMLAALAAVAARRYGWGEERFAGAAHAWREAAWRLNGVWEDFRDWLRLGR